MRITVAPGQWPGDDLEHVLAAADIAQEAGAAGVWFSEVNGFDAIALAALAGHRHRSIEITIGPIVAGVRSPAQMAMAVATLGRLSQVPPRTVIGAGNRRIVDDWHGRGSSDPAGRVEAHVHELRRILSGEATDSSTSRGFRLAVDRPRGVPVGVAALGPRMLSVAGAHADCVVLNLVPPGGVGQLSTTVLDAARAFGRPTPPVIVWMVVGDKDLSGPRITSFLRPYLAAEGYASVLAAAGVERPFDSDVALQLLTGIGPRAVAIERVRAYAEVGVDEVVLVGSSQDPGFAKVTAAVCGAFGQNGQRRPSTDQSGTNS